MKTAPTASAAPADFVAQLDSALARIAGEVLGGTPPRLAESVLYSLLGPGKRIRPRIVLAVADAFDVETETALHLATALELTHAYTLVHDDLPAMDNDDFRRGRPTNHKVYGEGLAVLAGDSLALLAPEVLTRLKGRLPADRILSLIEVLLAASGARGVIAGQAAEMTLGKNPAGIAALTEIFRLKTGALFRAALVLPAIAANADSALITRLGQFGDDLGIAFQIADDLEDDFAAKRTDPAHVAHYLDAQEARREAGARLALPASLPARLRTNLEPFVVELRRKIEGSST